ncbi:hypothetical protein RUM44_010295 [Polyplax serrata]|uniref:Ig-like domain-containing protein n=1 Tax=Polyplax serrata TaxID=468196 RepID=A0ABR1AVS3_POLSC
MSRTNGARNDLEAETKDKGTIYKVTEKFMTYKKVTDCTSKKLKEADIVISQLKDSITTAQEVEKSLRNQVQSSQNRLTIMQKNLRKFIVVSEKQQSNERVTLEHEKKINDLCMILKEISQKSQHVLQNVSNEISLIKKNKELKEALKSQESNYDLLKIEVQSLFKEKEKLEIQSEEKIKRLMNDLEKTKSENEEIRLQCNATLAIYKKQIEENERMIKEYEKERQNLLDDFELPNLNIDKNANNTSVNFSWADSTVSGTQEESLPNALREQVASIDDTGSTQISKPSHSQRSDSGLFQCVSTSNSNVKGKKKRSSQTLSKLNCVKQRPQLEFLTENQRNFTTLPPSPPIPPKRRLFSTNCNHYLS